MNPRKLPSAPKLLGACLLGLGMMSSAAWAQSASAEYKQSIQRCEQFTGEQRLTCRREAGAAVQAERQNKLTSPGPNEQANRDARCMRLPVSQQQDCMKTMSGQDTTIQGSVDGGGILRETTTVVPAPQ